MTIELGPLLFFLIKLVLFAVMHTVIGQAIALLLLFLVVAMKLRSAAQQGHLVSTLAWLSGLVFYSATMLVIYIPKMRL